MRILTVFFLFVCQLTTAQLLKNVELEVLGYPTWDMEVSLGEDGLILLVKSDVTKIEIFRFDQNLDQI